MAGKWTSVEVWLKGAATVQVVGEGRTLPITAHQFTDSFCTAGTPSTHDNCHDVHVYEILAPRTKSISGL